jgi:orotate phosphoribosyltransferase
VLTEAGAIVTKIIATIDRQEGARENIEGAGYKFDALLTRGDLGI